MVGDNNDPICEDLINFDLFAYCDLLSYEKVAQDDHWLKVMDEEIHITEKNNTWNLIDLSNSKKSIGIK